VVALVVCGPVKVVQKEGGVSGVKKGAIVLRSVYAGPMWWGICNLAEMLAKNPTRQYGGYVREAIQEMPASRRREVAKLISEQFRRYRADFIKYPYMKDL
jgi:hypothetical protein